MRVPPHNRARFGALLLAGLGALAILALPGVAAARDRNHDHIPDRWEARHHLSLKVNQANRDQDADQLDNRGEFEAGDNPRNPDSDGDGVPDGQENAGTIVSFEATSGVLVIDHFGGETVTGMVTESTRISCDGEHSSAASTSSRGPGEAGEGQSDQGEEPGDQDGNHDEGEGDGHHGEEPAGGDDGNQGPVGEQGEGENSGSGSPTSGPGNPGEEGGGATCTTADLISGAVVHEADLEVEHGTASFKEVKLSHSS